MREIDALLAAVAAADSSAKVAGPTKQVADALAVWAQSIDRRLAPAAAGYEWDATQAHELADQSRAQYLGAHLASGGRAVLGASQPVIYAPAGTPSVAVTWTPSYTPPAGSQMVYLIPIPAGTVPSSSSPDHHLAIVPADRTCYGLEQYDPVRQTASGIGVVAPGAVSETRPGMSNASRLPLSLVVTVEDVLAGRLRPLALGTPATATPGHASLYPADTDWNDPLIPYGQWLRLDPAQAPPSYPNRLLAYLDACLRQRGGFVRDQAPYLTVYADDAVNRGGNAAAWAKVGVTLDLSGGASYPIGCYLPGLPWSQLQALEPPPRIA